MSDMHSGTCVFGDPHHHLLRHAAACTWTREIPGIQLSIPSMSAAKCMCGEKDCNTVSCGSGSSPFHSPYLARCIQDSPYSAACVPDLCVRVFVSCLSSSIPHPLPTPILQHENCTYSWGPGNSLKLSCICWGTYVWALRSSHGQLGWVLHSGFKCPCAGESPLAPRARTLKATLYSCIVLGCEVPWYRVRTAPVFVSFFLLVYSLIISTVLSCHGISSLWSER